MDKVSIWIQTIVTFLAVIHAATLVLENGTGIWSWLAFATLFYLWFRFVASLIRKWPQDE